MVELPEVRIAVQWPGASPRQVERYVTAPIERSVQTVPGTAKVESSSEPGSAGIVLSVAEGYDLGAYVTQVNERLTLLRGVLPDRVQPRLTKKVPTALRDELGFITLQVVGPMTPDELRRLAEERLAPALSSLPGIANVEVEGGSQRELLIALSSDRLVGYGIEPEFVRQRLYEAMRDDVYGSLRGQGRDVLLMKPAEERVARISKLVVNDASGNRPPVHMDDVATLTLGRAPRRTISRIDGQSVVTLELERARGSHMIQVAEAVHDRVEELRGSLPEGGRIIVADDRTEEVREQLRDLVWRGGLGLVLVILVLLFMLKSVRAALVVLYSVAVALALGLALLGTLGLTLNLITIAGLVLVFGLLVDNCAVVVEQLVLQRPRFVKAGLRGITLAAAVTRATLGAVWLPLLGGTLSTMAVMLPLIYLSGELRALFLPFGVLVSLTLLFSLVSAALLVPVLGRFLPRDVEPLRRRILRRLASLPYFWAARFPRLSLVVLLLLLGLPLWVLPTEIAIESRRDPVPEPVARLATLYDATMGADGVRRARKVLDPALGGVLRPFFQTATFGQAWNYDVRPAVYVHLAFPPGSPIERADSLMDRFEMIALASPSVKRTIVRISEPAQTASMRVLFNDEALLTFEPFRMRERLIGQALLVGGLYVSVYGLVPDGYSSGLGYSSGGELVMAYGPNYEDLADLSERFARFMQRRSRRVISVNTNAGRFGWMGDQTRQVLSFRWDEDAQARTGADAQWLAGRMRPVFATTYPMLYADIERETRLPVRLIVEQADRMDVDRVIDRPLTVGDSTMLRLAGLADYSIVETPAGIERLNQQYRRYIRIDYRGPYQMARNFVREAVESFSVPAGYRLERGRYQFFEEDVKQDFAFVFMGAIFLVFLITAAIFESWRLPLVVMLSVPMAGIGVSLGFMWLGANFAEGAFIGTVLLVGIAVNDSILLTDRYRRLRQVRPTTSSGLLARLAVRERLRPMWTTTLTSVAAMLPLLLFPDSGEFWLGLAVTVVGGLLASTLLAPIASVALLSLFRRPSAKAPRE